MAYNSLQVLAYFVTVFIAAPLAFITGLGMSPALSTKFRWINKIFSIQVARSLHFLVLIWFLLFIVMHVTLVVATDALHNFNMMYTNTNDDHSWNGFWIFAVSLAVMIVLWVAVTPFTYRHPRMVQRIGYALIGPEHNDCLSTLIQTGPVHEKDISPSCGTTASTRETPEYKGLYETNFADYQSPGLRSSREPPGTKGPQAAAGPAPP